ncbi:MAG: hypothetical protein ACWGQW_07045 [bacterium]
MLIGKSNPKSFLGISKETVFKVEFYGQFIGTATRTKRGVWFAKDDKGTHLGKVTTKDAAIKSVLIRAGYCYVDCFDNSTHWSRKAYERIGRG